jgi:uncharacterized RmlC-like cupin family protein
MYADHELIPSPMNPAPGSGSEVVTVRPDTAIPTKQRLLNFVGVSGATAGALGLSMNFVVIPPGGAARPHLHRGYETAIYVLSGRVETRYGPGLRRSVVNQAGDFIFVPADLPHQPVNLSATEPVRAIEARNVADDQATVELYDPAVYSLGPQGEPQ